MMRLRGYRSHFALMLACLLAMPRAAHAGEGPKLGDLAPDSLGRSLLNKPVSLTDYRGKVVVVSFWATWCPYCIKELPVLEGLQSAGKGELQVIAVNWKEDRAVIRKLQKKLPDLKMMLASDPLGRAGEQYRVRGIPHLLIIGRDGKVEYQASGYDESMIDTIVTAVNAALAKPVPQDTPPAVNSTS